MRLIKTKKNEPSTIPLLKFFSEFSTDNGAKTPEALNILNPPYKKLESIILLCILISFLTVFTKIDGEIFIGDENNSNITNIENITHIITGTLIAFNAKIPFILNLSIKIVIPIIKIVP